MMYMNTVQSMAHPPTPQELVRRVEKLERQVEIIVIKMQQAAEAELQSRNEQIRVLGKDPSDYYDPTSVRPVSIPVPDYSI